MKKVIFIIIAIVSVELILYFFIGFPFSQIDYIFGYKPNDFPYKICEEDMICEVGIGELFTHEWFSSNKNCFPSTSAGYAYRDNYRYSENIKFAKNVSIKLPKQDWLLSCPMKKYNLFKAKESDQEYFFAVDYKCIHSECEEKIIKSPVKIINRKN